MKTIGGLGLIGLALFMLLGFINADLEMGFFVTLLTLLIAVGIPLAGGVYLIATKRWEAGRLAARKISLADKTMRSEVLRLAQAKGGKLTVVELVGEFSLDQEEAKALLSSLAGQGLAELEITESGLIVYSFPDLLNLPDKPKAKGVLDA